MRIYIDEDSDFQLIPHLRQLYPGNEYSSYLDERLSGYLDVELFPELARRAFDLIITGDKKQLKVGSAELAALKQSRLHWIGHPQVQAPGIVGFALRTASVLAGLPFAFAHIAESDAGSRWALTIKGVYRENKQRLGRTVQLS